MFANFSVFEARRLIALAVPVLLAQLTQILMTVVDTIMAGQVSPTDLAALSIATGIWNPLMLALQGILLALTGFVAQSFGAKDQTSIRHYVQQALYLALILSGIGLACASGAQYIVAMLDTSDAVTALTLDYINYVKWGLPAFLLYYVLRNHCEGVAFTKPAVIISLIGLVVNIPANYIFIYGKLGMPALGGAGCGIATALVFWSMAVGQTVYTLLSPRLDGRALFKTFEKPKLQSLWQLFTLGLPIAMATFFEVTLFACIPLFIADLGAIVVSGHQVAASVSTMLFMLPLSLSMAIAIRVGNLRGQNALDAMVMAIKTGFILAVMVAIFVASITYVLRFQVAALYTNNEEVVLLASAILILACCYQLPDALQVAANGVLRGLKYTKPISYITFISYWLIGFLLGFVLGKTDWIVPAMGPQGFWLGIILGLSVAALLLGNVVKKRINYELKH